LAAGGNGTCFVFLEVVYYRPVLEKGGLLSLSVVIPVYNEVKDIENTLHEIHRAFKESAIEMYEIILVDDGSTDNTTEVLRELSEQLCFRLFEHPNNRGYGAALKTGIRQSKFDVIAIADADGTYPIKEIPKLFKELDNYDMVVGARTGKDVNIPLVRRPAKWFLRKLANYLTGIKIPDLNSGLRVFRKKDVVNFFGILPSGFSFTTTITLAMLTNDMRVKYIPIDYLKRKGKSKIRPIRDTVNFLQLIFRTVLYFNPLKIFAPFAFLVFLASAGVLVYSMFWMDRILDTTVAILFVASIQMLSIGMIADIIDKRNKL
jgi:glycosyltransferase involved in cell wall biosynthesis